MNEIVDDGGPAFPVSTKGDPFGTTAPYGHQDSPTTWQFGGITVRDYFAAKALPVAAAEFWRSVAAGECGAPPEWRDGVAIDAYLMADAMIRARTNPRGETK